MGVSEIVDDILAHHGTKGMKWGVRKSEGASSRDRRREDPNFKFLRIGETKKDFQNARKDARFVTKTHGANLSVGRLHGKTTQAIVRDATKSMKPEVKAIGKKPEYNTKEAKKAIKKAYRQSRGYNPSDPIAAKYYKEVSDVYMKHIKASAPKHLQISPSGKWEDNLIIGKNHWQVGLKRVDTAKHADISKPDLTFRIRPIFDMDGYIVDFELLDDSMTQSSIIVEDILYHHGTKGMKWGVRKSASARVQQVKDARTRARSSEVTVSDKKKRIKTSGGAGHPAHPDAVAARTSGQIAKKSGTKALSNAQLKAFNERLNLEQQASRLRENDHSAAIRFIRKRLGKGAQQGVAEGTKAAINSPSSRMLMAKGATAVALAL